MLPRSSSGPAARTRASRPASPDHRAVATCPIVSSAAPRARSETGMSDAPKVVDWTAAWLDLIDLKISSARLPGKARSTAPSPDATAWQAGQTEGYAVVDVHFFHPDYATAMNLAIDFDAAAMGYPHVVSSNGRAVLFDRVECLSLPAEIPWLDDRSVRRIRATYSVSFRRR